MGLINERKLTKYKDELIDITNEFIKNLNEYGIEIIKDKKYRFKDGRSIKVFYDFLKKTYELNQDKEKEVINAFDSIYIEVYKVLKSEIEKFENSAKKIEIDEKKKIDKENAFIKKIEELENTIRLIKGIPDEEYSRNKKIYYFKDGDSKRLFYFRLKKECIKLLEKEELNDYEKLKIKAYNELVELIEEVRNQKKEENKLKTIERKEEKLEDYRNEINEKKDILINVIKEYGKIPEEKKDENLPFEFSDKVRYIVFYKFLERSYDSKLKDDPYKIIAREAYIEVTDVLNSVKSLNYILVRSSKPKPVKSQTSSKKIKEEPEKSLNITPVKEVKPISVKPLNQISLKQLNTLIEETNTNIKEHSIELIDTILRRERLPKTKEKNGGISEYTFQDGTDQREFYEHLKTRYNDTIKIKEKTKEEIELVRCFKNVEWYVGYVHLKRYYDKHKSVDVIYGYVSKIENNKVDLREWVNTQRKNYYKENKSQIQLEHEKMLDILCPGWLTPRENDIEKVLSRHKN